MRVTMHLAVDENGNPLTTDQRGQVRIVEFGTVDIGAVEGVFLLGDANQNDVVDFSDIAPFINLAFRRITFSNKADIDRNGVVDFSDIAPFINILAGGWFNRMRSLSPLAAHLQSVRRFQ